MKTILDEIIEKKLDETNRIVFATGKWDPYVGEDIIDQGVMTVIVREAFKED